MDKNALIIISCICMLFVIGRILIMPIKWILKLIFNTILGGLMLWIINIIGMNWAFHIGINIWTCICVGILGVPGAIFLILLKFFI